MSCGTGHRRGRRRAYVQNCVFRLRKEIWEGHAGDPSHPGTGYGSIPDSVDARRFERLVREARSVAARERQRRCERRSSCGAARRCRILPTGALPRMRSAILEEQRVNALQMRLEAELELGQHREAIGELDGLAREHPTHERLRWPSDACAAPARIGAWTRLPPTRGWVWRSSRSRAMEPGRSFGRRQPADPGRTTRR